MCFTSDLKVGYLSLLRQGRIKDVSFHFTEKPGFSLRAVSVDKQLYSILSFSTQVFK